jgi:hypothetical protein
MPAHVQSFESCRPCLRVMIPVVLATVSASSALAEARAVLSAVADARGVTVLLGKRVAMRYRYGDVPFKPYVEQLFTPGGVNVLRDSPFDHKHHHALMFAVAVDGINFWEEREDSGKETHRAVTEGSGPGAGIARPPSVREDWSSWAGLTESIDWLGPKSDKPLLREIRVVRALSGRDLDATLISWQTRLALPSGRESAAITGADYFGLGMRFLQSMDKEGHFVNADGKTGVAGTNAARSGWCAYTAKADGKSVTVAMFDHPMNLRHPATWFTMETPFAYLCATLKLKTEPLTITAKGPLVLCYGVAAWDGSVEPAQIEKLYKRWAELPVEVPVTLPSKGPPARKPA